MSVVLGSVTLSNPWILAPMAGVSEWPFRLIACEHGASAAPTELISARAMLEGTDRSERYLAKHPGEDLFWIQLFGGDADVMCRAAEAAAERGAHALDLNMGCPVRKVTKSGAGSALLTDPDRAGALVRAMVRGSGLPVTIKVRAGWDDETLNFVELSQACAEAGAVAVAMHARTRQQAYSGPARWEWIAQLVECSPIPVIGNGDAWTLSDAQRMLRETGCAAVMIGRGALGNPWIFSALQRGQSVEVTPEMRNRIVNTHFEYNLQHVGSELAAVRRFRKHLIWYSCGLEGSDSFQSEVLTVDGADEVRRHIDAFFSCERALKPATIQLEEKNALG